MILRAPGASFLVFWYLVMVYLPMTGAAPWGQARFYNAKVDWRSSGLGLGQSFFYGDSVCQSLICNTNFSARRAPAV